MDRMGAYTDDCLLKRLSEIEDDIMDMHISAYRTDTLSKEKIEIVMELRARGYQK